jgi:hypothetical protein
MRARRIYRNRFAVSASGSEAVQTKAFRSQVMREG